MANIWLEGRQNILTGLFKCLSILMRKRIRGNLSYIYRTRIYCDLLSCLKNIDIEVVIYLQFLKEKRLPCLC